LYGCYFHFGKEENTDAPINIERKKEEGNGKTNRSFIDEYRGKGGDTSGRGPGGERVCIFGKEKTGTLRPDISEGETRENEDMYGEL